MNEPISLNMKRAEKMGDCRLVSALDVLEELVNDIKKGKIRPPDHIFISMLEFDTKDPVDWQHHYRCAGMTHRDILALLEISKDCILRWIRG